MFLQLVLARHWREMFLHFSHIELRTLEISPEDVGLFYGAARESIDALRFPTAKHAITSKQGPRLTIRFRYCGEPSVGNQLLSSLREPIKPLNDTVKVLSYLEAQTTEFPQPPKPLPY